MFVCLVGGLLPLFFCSACCALWHCCQRCQHYFRGFSIDPVVFAQILQCCYSYAYLFDSDTEMLTLFPYICLFMMSAVAAAAAAVSATLQAFTFFACTTWRMCNVHLNFRVETFNLPDVVALYLLPANWNWFVCSSPIQLRATSSSATGWAKNSPAGLSAWALLCDSHKKLYLNTHSLKWAFEYIYVQFCA